VDYVGTDIFDWHGSPDGTYPHTASGALDWALHWQRTLTADPGGLDWTARFSELTGKPIIIPEWGLDFHTFGGQDDTYGLAEGSSCYRPLLGTGPRYLVRLARRPADS
jgi:hypothetical protein